MAFISKKIKNMMTIVVCIFVCVLAVTAYTLGIYQDKKS